MNTGNQNEKRRRREVEEMGKRFLSPPYSYIPYSTAVLRQTLN